MSGGENVAPTIPTGRTFEVVEPEMAAVLRSKSLAERLEIATKLWLHARQFLGAHLQSTHPEWTEQERSLEIARRMANGSW